MTGIPFQSIPGLILILCAVLLSSSSRGAGPPPVSIVDYMKSIDLDSSFDNRKKLFAEKWPGEEFKGTASQNTRLLKTLLEDSKRILLPLPSTSIENCTRFYSDPEIAKFLTKAFMENASKACIVTGTETPQQKIREKLQEIYRSSTPANGTQFTPEEHKAIHDAAYKAAGCKEDSAAIWGWYVVDKASLPKEVIKIAIDWFGECTVTAD